MGVFYFILAWRGLNTIKLKNVFFLSTSDKSAIKINPFMQLRSNFHKRVDRNKLKVSKFQSHSFSAIKKTLTEVEGGMGKFFLFLLLLSFVHINSQYKLNSYKSFFYNCQFIFFYCFTHFSSSASSLFCFFNFYFSFFYLSSWP